MRPPTCANICSCILPRSVTLALGLAADGLNDCEIARRLGVPRTTVRDWRNPRYAPRPTAGAAHARAAGGRRRGSRSATPTTQSCSASISATATSRALARTEQLRLSLDAKYPNVNDEIDALLRRCFPDNRVGRVLLDGGSTVVLHVYSSHLSCLFPQAGPGKKHERAIALEPWQAETGRGRAVGVPARLHPLGRLRVREPDRAATST